MVYDWGMRNTEGGHECMELCYGGTHHRCNAYCEDTRHADVFYYGTPHEFSLPACTVWEEARLFEAELGVTVTEIRPASEAPPPNITDPSQGCRIEPGFPEGFDSRCKHPYLVFFDSDPATFVKHRPPVSQ